MSSTNRQQAIYKAKEAHRLWITRAIKSAGFIVADSGFSYQIDGWFVYMDSEGKVQGANRPEEEE